MDYHPPSRLSNPAVIRNYSFPRALPCIILLLEKQDDLLLLLCDVPARVKGSCVRVLSALCWSRGGAGGSKVAGGCISIVSSFPALSTLCSELVDAHVLMCCTAAIEQMDGS